MQKWSRILHFLLNWNDLCGWFLLLQFIIQKWVKYYVMWKYHYRNIHHIILIALQYNCNHPFDPVCLAFLPCIQKDAKKCEKKSSKIFEFDIFLYLKSKVAGKVGLILSYQMQAMQGCKPFTILMITIAA